MGWSPARVEDDQVLGAVAVDVQRPDQPGLLGGVGHPLGLGERPRGGLVDEHQLVLRQQRDVVPAVLVQVADGQGAGTLDRLARADLLGAAEPPLPLVEEDLHLGRRTVEHHVGLAVAVEVAGVHADDFLVHRDAHQPHPPVVLEVVGVLAERAVRLVVVGLLGAQQQVDPRPAVIADDDVVDLVAVQVLEHQVADPMLELVDLQGLEPEVIGELRLLLRGLGGRIQPDEQARREGQNTPRSGRGSFCITRFLMSPGAVP